MIFLFKPIKPPRLKVDAMRFALLSGMHEIKRGMLGDWKLITDTWDHKVFWDVQISLKGGPTVLVGSDDQILRWLNDGTKPHSIPKGKGKKTLWYQPGFTPKSTPNVIGSKKGGKYGPFISRKKVFHPGFEARNYEKVLKEKWEPRFKRRMEQAMREAAKKSGHGV
jgi:hypothetical protein